MIEHKTDRGDTIWLHENPMKSSIEAFNSKYGTNCATYAEVLSISAKMVIEDVKATPFGKKLYNFISNDLQGILKKYDRGDYTFDFAGKLLDGEFVKWFAVQMKKAAFEEERWDKKQLKTSIEEWLAAIEPDDDDSLPLWFRTKTKCVDEYNEQQMQFFHMVRLEFYDQKD